MRLTSAVVLLLGSISVRTYCQDSISSNGVDQLKSLSIEELMNLEVTSVARHPIKLSKSPSAIQVITNDDFSRLGVTRLTEALRLASNLEVVQRDASQWSISARGFNSSTSNKMLVLIDGRIVYSPLFAGVFWDIQDMLLDNVDRIEVISGPGGTQWGANAVNGVINIITKDAAQTKGLFAEIGSGTELKSIAGLRMGGKLGANGSYRVYGKYSGRDGSVHPDGSNINNDWYQGQGGFRLDWSHPDADNFTLQGDLYQSEMQMPVSGDSVTETHGANLLARWTHNFSERSNLESMIYYDHVQRSSTGSYEDRLNTFSLEIRHHFYSGERHEIDWGGELLQSRDDFTEGSVVFLPPSISLPVYTVFFQDQIMLMEDRLYLTVGSKLLHNRYTGFEHQPGARLAYAMPSRQQLLWTAVSRTVRTPSRVDRDLYIDPLLQGGPNFKSEVLYAYELGYRIRPIDPILLSIATFYDDYLNIRSIEQLNPPNPIPIQIANGLIATGYGVEFTMDYQVTRAFSLRLGYTENHVDLRANEGSTDTSSSSSEAPDPEHYFTFRSSLNLGKRIHLAESFRFVSEIGAPMNVPSYSELDLNVSYELTPKFQIAITGQNLLHDHHPEFGNLGSRTEIERSIYARITARL